MRWATLFCCTFGALSAACCAGEPQVLDRELRHLRIAGPREWSEFAERPDAARLELRFASQANAKPWTLQLRQQDVKQAWRVSLNEKQIGQLARDENDMVVYFDVPAGILHEGENTLLVEQDARGRPTPDDIRVGEVVLHRAPRQDVLDAATVKIEVADADQRRSPARITIVNEAGALQTTSAASDNRLAVRPGTVYTATGLAEFGLPAGKYTIYAGRGFEYSLAAADVTLAAGDEKSLKLSIRRETPTEGYVACDTHVHTLTHSGHGDATVQERMITLAAEGIELPIATDHNVHIDHEPFAREMNVRRYLTPVIGNEVTTPVGHFNIFPVRPGAEIPNYRLRDWYTILEGIYRTPGVKVSILNHARDVHSGVRPFAPKLFNDVAGEQLKGWSMGFNAMEVVNSSATQSDPLRLFFDWMALLNRGRNVTPVGSSDSHDVARHFVGQGRTYIRCDDRDPGAIDVDMAVNNFVQGRVMVSYGLLAELTVEGKYGSGELARATGDAVTVAARVLGPHWIQASKVTLYANGVAIREADVVADGRRDLPAGVKWRGSWTLPKPEHDVYLVAIAIGPGISGPYWKTAKPYQPTSPEWTPQVIGCSGAVWYDADGDGRKTSAHEYARGLVCEAAGDLKLLLKRLADYDEAVAAQAAHLLQSSGVSLLADETQAAIGAAAPRVQAGFRNYLNAWRKCQIARIGS